jgi:K+-sensing histidine kinase KdpD
LKSLPQSPALLQEEKYLVKKIKEKYWMVIGEGSVFILLLGIGVSIARKAYKKELEVAQQQKNFMMSITHEFKSPIAAIRLNLETLLKRDMEKPQQKNMLSRALIETDRVNFLVENILIATRIEAANMDFAFSKINLSACIDELISFKQEASGRHPIKANIEKDIYISGDRLAIASLVINLIENAEKYTPANSAITLNLFQLNNEAFLQVCDGGPGVPTQERRKIFEKFYRIGNEETRTTKGTGLGLYICRYIALKHRGKITVKENIPNGSIFETVFPVLQNS